MNYKIFGHLVCYNEFPDILRAIESMYPFCDKIMIVYGGKPGTPLRNFLENRKDIYNLEIYDNPFTTLRNQRNFLLKKTPKNNWIAQLDPDEQFTRKLQKRIREYVSRIDPQLYDDPNRKVPLIVPINHYNLYGDMLHYDGTPIYHHMKFFYYDRDLRWYGKFHCHITYGGKKDRGVVYKTPIVKGFAILHYARLTPNRIKWRQKHLGDEKYGGYNKNSWQEDSLAMIPVPSECL